MKRFIGIICKIMCAGGHCAHGKKKNVVPIFFVYEIVCTYTRPPLILWKQSGACIPDTFFLLWKPDFFFYKIPSGVSLEGETLSHLFQYVTYFGATQRIPQCFSKKVDSKPPPLTKPRRESYRKKKIGLSEKEKSLCAYIASWWQFQLLWSLLFFFFLIPLRTVSTFNIEDVFTP